MENQWWEDSSDKETAGVRLVEDDFENRSMPAISEDWQQFDRKCYLWATEEKRNWTEAENL